MNSHRGYNPVFWLEAIAIFAFGTSRFIKGETLLKDEVGPETATPFDDEAIIKETMAFAEAWSEGDAKTAASFYTEDGLRVGAFGDVQKGQAAIEAAYDKLLHQTMPGARVKQERGSVRMLSPELAIWQGGIEIIPAGGGTALKGHVVHVMKKVRGRWLILEAHPKIFPPPPTG